NAAVFSGIIRPCERDSSSPLRSPRSFPPRRAPVTAQPELHTGRLRLRRWLPDDLAPFAAMNADPRVTEYLPTPLSAEDSNALVARAEAHFEQHGFGLWAAEIP